MRGCPTCPDCQKVISRWKPEEPHRPVLEEAPVFHPTEEEFKETLHYVASIRQKAEHIGMCRIVPPPSWKPPGLTTEKNVCKALKFETHIQLVNELQDQFLKTKMDVVQEEMKCKRQKIQSSYEYRFPGAIKIQSNAEGGISKSGPILTLDDFEKYGNDFKRQYFSGKVKAASSNSNANMYKEGWVPTVEDVEGEYWRIVEHPSEEIEVLHGSNEVGVSTTGFPVNHISAETSKSHEYLESGWNLNNIYKLRGSLLWHENDRTSASLRPKISAGMCLSSVCWKVEDHHLYSLCYMHLGGPKVWYVVPGRFCYKFDKVVKKHLAQCSQHPEFLYRNVPQLSPSTLIAEGIPVYRCVQNPGEFLLIFPAAYNSHFNCGFGCSEAVSFAPFDWLPYGQNVIDIYSEQRRRTSISYDKILLGAAAEAVKAQWQLILLKAKLLDEVPWTTVSGKDGILTKALKARVKHEAIMREYLCNGLRSQKMEDNFDVQTKRECSICLYDLHLSAIGCKCSEDRFVCMLHAKDLCSCSWTARFLLARYEIGELDILVAALEGKLESVYKWGKQKLGLKMTTSNNNLKDANVELSPVKPEALSSVSPRLSTLLRERRKDPWIGQVPASAQRHDDVCDKVDSENCGREDADNYTASKSSNLTSNKEEPKNSDSQRNVVVIDDED
ncbi:OLC1v1007013C2 [Oldenlandia corymbosa var. corymbosa]|nr:OLC1v1007013C2 [Oldenlandia corymbosa var. corymbosa]